METREFTLENDVCVCVSVCACAMEFQRT